MFAEVWIVADFFARRVEVRPACLAVSRRREVRVPTQLLEGVVDPRSGPERLELFGLNDSVAGDLVGLATPLLDRFSDRVLVALLCALRWVALARSRRFLDSTQTFLGRYLEQFDALAGGDLMPITRPPFLDERDGLPATRCLLV